LYETIKGNIIKAITMIMQIAIRKPLVIQFEKGGDNVDSPNNF